MYICTYINRERERERERDREKYIYIYIYVCMYVCIHIYIYICMCIYIYIYISISIYVFIGIFALLPTEFTRVSLQYVLDPDLEAAIRSTSEISSCFLGRDPGTLKFDIVSKKTSTIILFGFETLKLKIRRLKLWKPTVILAK